MFIYLDETKQEYENRKELHVSIVKDRFAKAGMQIIGRTDVVDEIVAYLIEKYGQEILDYRK